MPAAMPYGWRVCELAMLHVSRSLVIFHDLAAQDSPFRHELPRDSEPPTFGNRCQQSSTCALLILPQDIALTDFVGGFPYA